MKEEEMFLQKQSEMTDKELCEAIEVEISNLCKTGGRSMTMTVPPQIKDTDMLICELLKRFKRISICD